MVTADRRAYQVAAQVVDPELAPVTIAELGILRTVRTDGTRAVVTIVPTYAACPALAAIRADVVAALRAAGWSEVEVVTEMGTWSTDQITSSGRAKLAAAGIAPPVAGSGPPAGGTEAAPPQLPLVAPASPVPACPRCGSTQVAQLSRFGATACTAAWRCDACGEPFPHLKDV